MQYLLLVYADEKHWAGLSEAEKERHWVDCQAYGRQLMDGGHFLAGAPLEPSATARSIRKLDETASVTDGPFAETKEVLAGYFLVECKDIDEAVALGKQFPGVRRGDGLEVRALREDRIMRLP